jgi:hypothetical protein
MHSHRLKGQLCAMVGNGKFFRRLWHPLDSSLGRRDFDRASVTDFEDIKEEIRLAN